MKVTVDKNFVTISFKDTYWAGAGEEIIILKKRYFVFYHGRWDFRYNIFRDYLIKNGFNGCFLSSEELYTKDKTKDERKRIRDWRGLHNIDVWDLSLVFKDVDFIDNYSDINKDIETILNSNIVKRF